MNSLKLFGIDQVLWPDHCVQYTDGAKLHPELKAPELEDCIVVKGVDPEIDSYSGFYDNDHKTATRLGDILKSKGIEAVDVCGLATDYCVKFTALDAAKEGFETRVLWNASRGVFVNYP